MKKQSLINAFFFSSALILIGSCSKTSDDPKSLAEQTESFAKQAFAAFQDDDYESFEKLTVGRLTFSEFESIFTDHVDKGRKLAETKVKESSGEEKEKWEERLNGIKDLKDDEEKFQAELSKLFLRSTFQEIEFEEWQEIAKSLKNHKGDGKSSKSDYEEWKEDGPKDNKTNMKKYFNRVISKANAFGFNWEEATFEDIKVDEEDREEIDDYDLEILIKHDDKELRIKLECIDTNQGIFIVDTPRLEGVDGDISGPQRNATR